ncbi:MAG: hypothetical protein WKF55_01170 [Gemmatimonadaceae bacterium]
MAEYLLGPEVRRMVTTHLASMDHMEVLVQLYDRAPAAIASTEVTRRLGRPPELVETALGDLVEGGLVASVASGSGANEFKYDPSSQSLRNAVEELMTMYKERPVTLIRAIYDRPAEPVISFAEAFRVRAGN